MSPLNPFQSLDLDQPLPIVVRGRPSLVTRTALTPQEWVIAEAIAPPQPRGYLHPTAGWVAGGWPA